MSKNEMFSFPFPTTPLEHSGIITLAINDNILVLLEGMGEDPTEQISIVLHEWRMTGNLRDFIHGMLERAGDHPHTFVKLDKPFACWKVLSMSVEGNLTTPFAHTLVKIPYKPVEPNFNFSQRDCVAGRTYAWVDEDAAKSHCLRKGDFYFRVWGEGWCSIEFDKLGFEKLRARRLK